MDNIKYYEDLTHKFLLAYESSTEFFVRYNPETNQWQDCNISFLCFKHDYDYKEISKEEVIKRTNGTLPEEKLKNFLIMINKNRNEN